MISTVCRDEEICPAGDDMRRICATAIVACFLATGCDFARLPFFRPDPRAIVPERFSSDAAVRRLAIALEGADQSAVEAAVAAGADVNATGTAGFRLLFWTMVRDNLRGFESLLKHGADWNADYLEPRFLPDDSYRHAVLELAVGARNPKWLQALLRQGMSPDYASHSGNRSRLIFYAERTDSAAAIRTLVEAGADLNIRDSAGYTPLVRSMMACEYNTTWLLLDLGADPTVQDHKGRTLADSLRLYGSRGVRADHRESFEKIVSDLVNRGLLTREDIVEADKPKPSVFDEEPPGGSIGHYPGFEDQRQLLRLDPADGEANGSDRH
jgi:hypothetical protein